MTKTGYGAFNPAKQASVQRAPLNNNNRRMSRKWQMCWRCQEDKPLLGGSVTMLGGHIPGAVRKFICLDCLNAMQKKSEGGAA